jgi:hypothetical protein
LFDNFLDNRAVDRYADYTVVVFANGVGHDLLFGGIVAAVVVYFYARSRQLGKEVRLVRREFNAGTL